MTIGIIYARGHTLAGLRIRHHDDGSPRRWSHCGVIDGDSVIESCWPGGVRRTPRAEFDRRYSHTEIVAYATPDPVAGIAAARAAVGTPYPVLTVLGRIFRLHIKQPGMQCSHLVEHTLTAARLTRWRGELHRMTPNRVYDNLMGVT